MNREFVQDSLQLQSRKRPSPALAPNINDNDLLELEALVCRPQASKVPKLSNGLQSEPALKSNDRSFDYQYDTSWSNYHSDPSPSLRSQEETVSEASEYGTALWETDRKLTHASQIQYP